MELIQNYINYYLTVQTGCRPGRQRRVAGSGTGVGRSSGRGTGTGVGRAYNWEPLPGGQDCHWQDQPPRSRDRTQPGPGLRPRGGDKIRPTSDRGAGTGVGRASDRGTGIGTVWTANWEPLAGVDRAGVGQRTTIRSGTEK